MYVRTRRPSLGADTQPEPVNFGRIAKIAAGVGLIIWALSGITHQPRSSS